MNEIVIDINELTYDQLTERMWAVAADNDLDSVAVCFRGGEADSSVNLAILQLLDLYPHWSFEIPF